jgi:hypothetical protein
LELASDEDGTWGDRARPARAKDETAEAGKKQAPVSEYDNTTERRDNVALI